MCTQSNFADQSRGTNAPCNTRRHSHKLCWGNGATRTSFTCCDAGAYRTICPVRRRNPSGTWARLASRVDGILQLVQQDALADGGLLEHGLQGVVQRVLGVAHVVSVQEVVLDLEATQQVGVDTGNQLDVVGARNLLHLGLDRLPLLIRQDLGRDDASRHDVLRLVELLHVVVSDHAQAIEASLLGEEAEKTRQYRGFHSHHLGDLRSPVHVGHVYTCLAIDQVQVLLGTFQLVVQDHLVELSHLHDVLRDRHALALLGGSVDQGQHVDLKGAVQALDLFRVLHLSRERAHLRVPASGDRGRSPDKGCRLRSPAREEQAKSQAEDNGRSGAAACHAR
mmetsp:Transcript_83481/g.269102  ORF Transcript_83481/g.269102 Transcript_83481/m.269102 type:complete len:337 (-) Transcript_83481:93-1103(-)